MALTQQQLAIQMIRQLRILDPSASAELGTPERKLLDTVAEAIAGVQVDTSALNSTFNLDSKFGDSLDQFLNIFNFGRQRGTAAIGIVEFSRPNESTLDTIIPNGSQVSSINPANGVVQATFRTTQEGVIPAGPDLSTLIPVRAINVGSAGNVAADTIKAFGSTVISGITQITNANPTTGGLDPETDAALKVRFKNTFFRNLAGTQDQYLALAVAGAFTNRANVVGPLSRYREYIQVPATNDSLDSGGGLSGEYSSALSTIPYSSYTYDSVPTFVSNGQGGLGSVFYTEGVDFRLNVSGTDKDQGDALRQFTAGHDVNPATTNVRPSVTFLNVYTLDDEAVDSVRPGDVVLFEHTYVSSASRNDISRSINNCVDVFVNGENATPATTVIPKPTGGSIPFQDNPTHRYHFEHYRRAGEPDHRPVLGNIFTPLLWNPLIDLPSRITVDNFTYLKGTHYWPIIDVSANGGTVRARTGIEWSATARGFEGDAATGPTILANGATSIEVTDYTFDKNIPDLQVALEGSKQVTTDPLVHKAILRYFKFDITVMYVPGASITATNQSISSTVQSFLENTYFGSVVQLSDILQVIHDVPGVDNVRWTDQANPGVTETDINGNPRLGGVVDRYTEGNLTTTEVQRAYLTGSPTGGTYKIQVIPGQVTSSIAYNASGATVNAALSTLTPTVTATGSGTPSNPFVFTFPAPLARDLIQIVGDGLQGNSTVFDSDFFLKDNEQATIPTGTISGDSAPGFIIRTRAQNTFSS